MATENKIRYKQNKKTNIILNRGNGYENTSMYMYVHNYIHTNLIK